MTRLVIIRCILLVQLNSGNRGTFTLTAKSYTYLGTVLTPSGSFAVNQKNLYNKGLRVLFSLLKLFHPRGGTSIKKFMKLYNALVRPILLYNCEVRGAYCKRFNNFAAFEKLLFNSDLLCEKLNIKMYKILLGVSPKSTNVAVRAELGALPMHVAIYHSSVKFFFHLLEHTDNPLLDNALKTSCDLTGNGGWSWFSLISLLYKLSNIKMKKYTIASNLDWKSIIKLVKDTLTNRYINRWNTEREEVTKGNKESKLDFYGMIKTKYIAEDYLVEVHDFDTRRAVTQLRISAHRLPVEQGRHKGVPRDQRLCKLCTSSEVGNEIHYLSKCTHPRFAHTRSLFIEKLYRINPFFSSFDLPNLFLYVSTMKDKNINKVSSLYLKELLDIFEEETVSLV